MNPPANANSTLSVIVNWGGLAGSQRQRRGVHDKNVHILLRIDDCEGASFEDATGRSEADIVDGYVAVGMGDDIGAEDGDGDKFSGPDIAADLSRSYSDVIVHTATENK